MVVGLKVFPARLFRIRGTSALGHVERNQPNPVVRPLLPYHLQRNPIVHLPVMQGYDSLSYFQSVNNNIETFIYSSAGSDG